MKLQPRWPLYMEISRHNAPTLEVDPGETFVVETELCTGDWLKTPEDVWSPERRTASNPSSGCIYVRGAGPEHALVVRVLDIQVDSLGYTGFSPGVTPFPDWIRDREWGVVSKTVRIRDGRVRWSERLTLPIDPMIGTIGTAPASGVPRTVENGPFGGNLDVQEVRAGSTVYLPVFLDGGLLHLGDVHAIQGDGEICCGGGIETRGTVTLTVDLVPRPPRMKWPRIETADHIIAVGCARPAEDAFRIATTELVRWMADDYGFAETEAFLLLGQVLEARCTQFVDPLFTYVCKVRKEYLIP